MFDLTTSDLKKSIISCGDGPASFNSTMYQKGNKVVSIDPIYQLTAEEIEKHIEDTYETVIRQTKQNKEKFNWSQIENVEELAHIRMKAMKKFLRDYKTGKEEDRYINAELPVLPFRDNQFELALSSHFLFLYTENLSLEFHVSSISEMLRIASEVRIFPLLDLNGHTSPYVDYIAHEFSKKGYAVEKIRVSYEFQKSGNLMLKIRRS